MAGLAEAWIRERASIVLADGALPPRAAQPAAARAPSPQAADVWRGAYMMAYMAMAYVAMA